MDRNEEFVQKLACLQCGVRVRNKRNSYRLHSQANVYHFHYRCAKCYSEYQTVVSQEVVVRLRELGITTQQQGKTNQTVALVDANTSWTYFTIPKFHRNRKERRKMKKYRRAFKKQIRASGNQCLSEIAAQEGRKKRKPHSD